jgi:hypothetical protein
MIWIFGDSFSTPFGDKTVFESWSKNYINHKGYIPKTFGDIISEQLGTEVKHISRGGIGNDYIFEIIYENTPFINKDDIVIIGWSSLLRFRLVNCNNRWIDMVPNSNFESVLKTLPNISQNTLDEMFINRSLNLYENELIKRRNFINWLFRDNILIQWTPFYEQFKFISGFNGINTIIKETNGEIDDGHYSEMGHMELSKKFMDLILNKDKRDLFNFMTKKLL